MTVTRTFKMHWLLNMMALGQCRQVYYEDKPVITRFTRRGTGNHRLIKTIFACQYARGMPNSHEVLFVSKSGSSQSSSDSDNATGTTVPMAGSANDDKVKFKLNLKASPSGAPLKLVSTYKWTASSLLEKVPGVQVQVVCWNFLYYALLSSNRTSAKERVSGPNK
jgi:hypothetical protein